MKKQLLTSLFLLPLLVTGLTGCENVRYVGNQMVTGSKTYYYALVNSQVTGTKYYHISGWAEYGPDGLSFDNGYMGQYVGLELQLYTSKDVVYYYEPNLMYMLSKNYNPDYGVAIE